MPIEKLELQQLRQQSASLKGVGNAFELEFWHRVLKPLGALAFVLFSASFVIGVRPRRTTGGLVVAGIATAFILYLVQQFVSNLIFIASEQALVAVTLPIGLVLAIALYRITKLAEVRG